MNWTRQQRARSGRRGETMSLEQAIPFPFKPQEVIDHTSGFLALSPHSRRYIIDGLPGFIAYREQGKHLISMGGVHAAAEARERLLDGFLAETERRRRRFLAVQVPESQVQIFIARGITVTQMGSSFGRRLGKLSFAGTKHVKLRNKIKRAREAAMCVCAAGRGLPSDGRTVAGLPGLSASR